MPETTARAEILARIRRALPGEPSGLAASYAAIPRPLQRDGTLFPEACLDLLVDRLHDYDTEVLEISHEHEIPHAIATALAHKHEHRLVIATDFPNKWLPEGIEVALDGRPPLSATEIDRAQAVVTTCEGAIASTGTLLLVHGGAQGRRILTLLPDHHICLVRRDQVVETVPEGFALIAAQTRKPITTISGPSATSDIEMVRIRGVHGPRRLTVILYGLHQLAKPLRQ